MNLSVFMMKRLLLDVPVCCSDSGPLLLTRVRSLCRLLNLYGGRQTVRQMGVTVSNSVEKWGNTTRSILDHQGDQGLTKCHPSIISSAVISEQGRWLCWLKDNVSKSKAEALRWSVFLKHGGATWRCVILSREGRSALSQHQALEPRDERG